MDNCASKIIEQMSALDSNDDGIKANQKYKHILSVIQTECTTAKHLREVYQQLNEQSLKDAEFALKFAMLGSSRLFQTLELFGQKIKSLMMAVLRENYENLDTLRDTCIDSFYNSITLFGEYYNRARLSDGSPMKTLVLPLIEYFKDMLRMNTERSAREFTTQITLNGEIMNKTHPDEVADLMIFVRKQMLSSQIENESARIWLMLCVDLSHNHFHVIDAKLERFYDETLKAAQKMTTKSKKDGNEVMNTTKSEVTNTQKSDLNTNNDVVNSKIDVTSSKNDVTKSKDVITNTNNDITTNTETDGHDESHKTADIIAKDLTNVQIRESPDRSAKTIADDSGVVIDQNKTTDTSLSNVRTDNPRLRRISNNEISNNDSTSTTTTTTGKTRNDVQIYRPPRFRINSGSGNHQSNNTENVIKNTKSHNNTDSCKNNANWATQDSTTKQFSYFRSHSNDKINNIPPPSSNNKIKSWADEVEDYNNTLDAQRKRETSNNHNHQQQRTPMNQRPQSKLLSPRERIKARLSPHQALLEKAQRLSLLKQQQNNTNSIHSSNDDGYHNKVQHGTKQNSFHSTSRSSNGGGAFVTADGGGGTGRYNNEVRKPAVKPVKAYLRDENVENLSWNQTGADIHDDFYPAKNDNSPRFLNYLQRN